MALIYHLTHRTTWETAQSTGALSADSLEREGFIHCSFPHQLEKVANRFYAGQTDLVLTQINTAHLKSALKIEAPVDPRTGQPEAEKGEFPHIYGTINLDAVVQVHAWRPNEDGVFMLPGWVG